MVEGVGLAESTNISHLSLPIPYKDFRKVRKHKKVREDSWFDKCRALNPREFVLGLSKVHMNQLACAHE